MPLPVIYHYHIAISIIINGFNYCSICHSNKICTYWRTNICTTMQFIYTEL